MSALHACHPLIRVPKVWDSLVAIFTNIGMLTAVRRSQTGSLKGDQNVAIKTLRFGLESLGQTLEAATFRGGE